MGMYRRQDGTLPETILNKSYTNNNNENTLKPNPLTFYPINPCSPQMPKKKKKSMGFTVCPKSSQIQAVAGHGRELQSDNVAVHLPTLPRRTPILIATSYNLNERSSCSDISKCSSSTKAEGGAVSQVIRS